MSQQTGFHVYDTTLRDGAQQEGLNLTVADKLHIARHLDDLGVGFIEGGWPGANPKDTEFFRRARRSSTSSTPSSPPSAPPAGPASTAADDPLVAALRDSGAGVVTLVAKSHDRHVELALRTTLEENLAMVRDTVSHLRAEGQQVFLDAEHFFDGYRANRDYALEVLRTAAEAGADVVALCDTNGGMLPARVADVVHDVLETTGARVGIHCHDDTGCAVANTLAAVDAGATHVQGTLNGYGERTGNADLFPVVANLELKLGRQVLPGGRPARGDPDRPRGRRGHQRPAVVPPALRRRLAPSRTRPGCTPPRSRSTPTSTSTSTPSRSATTCGCSSPTWPAAPRSSSRAASSASTSDDRELVEPGHRPGQGARVAGLHVRGRRRLLRAAAASRRSRARVRRTSRSSPGASSPRLAPGRRGDPEATVKLCAGGARIVATGEGNGPVNALDHALREAIGQAYPELAKFELIDYKVRILDQGHGTDAVTRVLIETTDGETSWVTVGVGDNVIEASWGALVDGVTFGLRRHEV